MTMSFDHVKQKFGNGRNSWNRVAGPAAALWLSLTRVGWTWKAAHHFIDDAGEHWDIRFDPPTAIADAMRRSVRRGRLNKVAAIHPDLVPARLDKGTSVNGKKDIIIDVTNILAPLVGGRKASLQDTPEFERKHASALLSAASGGQWPQVRKAKIS